MEQVLLYKLLQIQPLPTRFHPVWQICQESLRWMVLMFLSRILQKIMLTSPLMLEGVKRGDMDTQEAALAVLMARNDPEALPMALSRRDGAPFAALYGSRVDREFRRSCGRRAIAGWRAANHPAR